MDHVMSVELPDLSRRAIDWAVLRASAQHPAVVYPAAAGVLGGLGAVLLTASPVLLAGAAIGGGVALASLGVNYLFRHQYFAARYIETAHQALVAYRAGTLENLEHDLREAGSREGRSQFERFNEKIKAFEEVLDDKLGRREITYGRFLGIAEQVFLSGMDNLRQIAISLKNMQTVDEKYIRQRIAALETPEQSSEMKAQELASLKQQLDVRSQQLGKVEARLAQNEQALSQLDLALAAIADMKTGSSQADTSMETAMSDLQQIARRAGEYSSPQG
jgi:hypothetical protein